MSVETRLQSRSAEFQKLQADLEIFVDKRTRLDAQLSENEMVKKEFATLSPNNIIFKLVGPVLVPQDHAEARTNVETRLDFIQSEMHRKRVDTQIKETEDQMEKKKLELVDLQTQLQATSSATSG